MERKFSINDFRKAVDDAYEAVKGIKEGEVDPRNIGADPESFGITVAFTDGTVINKADTQVKAPIGAIAKVGVQSILFSQNTPEEVIKKSGACVLKKVEAKPKGLVTSADGVRAFSAVEPVGDFDSKWNLFEDRMIDMMGTAPELNDKVYEELKKELVDSNFVDALAKDGYYLYDDAAGSADLYQRAKAMTASTEQLAMMGATIAADGVNPQTQKIVYDGAISQYLVAGMAAKGPHKMNKPWLEMAGIPGKRSFGGSIVAIYPGQFAIAAYSPRLNAAGVSVRAAKAIIHVMKSLDISLFASAPIVVEK